MSSVDLWNTNGTEALVFQSLSIQRTHAPKPSVARWYWTVIDFDPVPTLEGLSIPLLFVFGEPQYDRLGPVAEDVRNVEALQSAGHDCQAVVFDGADHNLRLVEGGVFGGLLPRRGTVRTHCADVAGRAYRESMMGRRGHPK